MRDRFQWARLLAFVTVWSAKKKFVATQPPSQAHIHDAGRRVRISSQPGSRQADCVGARWKEAGPTWAPADPGLTRNVASRGYHAWSTPEKLCGEGDLGQRLPPQARTNLGEPGPFRIR